MTTPSRGFTLVEVLTTVAVAGILLVTAVWSMGDALPAYRASGAAQRFVLDARNALALAARANETVHLVRLPDAAGCGQAYRMVQGANPAAPTRELDRVCLDGDFPGVAMDAAGIAAPVTCADEAPAAGLAVCTFCEPGARLTFYPTGEVVAVSAAGGVQAGGHSVVFAPERGSNRQLRALAVGVRSGTGRARTYSYEPTAGTKWECR